MNRSPKAHLISGLLIAIGVILAHGKGMLLMACIVLALYLLIIGEFSILRRSLAAITPIAAMLFAVDWLLSHLASATQLRSPVVTSLRLSALMLAFGYVATFFQSEQTAERLASLGLNGEWLVIALSATTTLPLMQATAVQITDARFAAGLIPSRSPLSTVFQLPHVLRPLFTQALRVAVARSDAWHQRCLMLRLNRNLVVNQLKSTIGPIDLAALVIPAAWLVLIALTEYR